MIWTTIDGVPAAAILGRGEPYTLWRTSTIGGGHGHVWPYGRTRERGLVVLGLPVDALPPPRAPVGAQASLFT